MSYSLGGWAIWEFGLFMRTSKFLVNGGTINGLTLIDLWSTSLCAFFVILPLWLLFHPNLFCAYDVLLLLQLCRSFALLFSTMNVKLLKIFFLLDVAIIFKGVLFSESSVYSSLSVALLCYSQASYWCFSLIYFKVTTTQCFRIHLSIGIYFHTFGVFVLFVFGKEEIT